MENASKALLIAGGVLIAIIIVSVGVYLYSMYSSQANQYKEIMANNEIIKFNSNFDVYLGREDILPEEIVTVINLAKEKSISLNVKIGATQLTFGKNGTCTMSAEKFLSTYSDCIFKCVPKQTAPMNPKFDSEGKITEIQFVKK